MCSGSTLASNESYVLQSVIEAHRRGLSIIIHCTCRRMSVTPPAIQTFTPAGNAIMSVPAQATAETVLPAPRWQEPRAGARS